MMPRALYSVVVTPIVLATVISLSGCGPAAPKPAATVNGRSVSAEEVTKQFEQMKKSSPATFSGTDAAAKEIEFKARVLENLIQIELIKEAAEKLGITIDAKQVDDYIAKLETQYGGKTGLEDAMKQSGISLDQLKESVKSRLLLDALAAKVVTVTDVSEADAQTYYDKNPSLFKNDAQVHAAHILVPEKDQALADKLLAQVNAGGDFAALAKANSTDPGSKDNGGDLGWSAPTAYVAEFAKAVTEMKPGQTRLVKSQFGWHIIKLIETKPAGQKAFAEVKDQIISLLKDQKRTEEFTKYVDELRKKAKIEILDATLKKAIDATAAASSSATTAP
jgi:foldase protein PrsA